jgi:hypothetical protein
MNPEGDMPWDGRLCHWVGRGLVGAPYGRPIGAVVWSNDVYDIWPRWECATTRAGSDMTVGAPFRYATRPYPRHEAANARPTQAFAPTESFGIRREE